MADPIINTTEIIEGISPALLDKLSPLFAIFKAIGIVLLIYIIFLIIKAVFRWKTSFDISRISRNVEQINDKLDVLIKREERPKIEKSKRKK